MTRIIALLAFATILAPSAAAQRDCSGVRFDRMEKITSFTQLDDDSERPSLEFARVNADRCATARISGILGFSSAQTDVVAMADGARADFRERTPAIDHSLSLQARSDGTIERRYRLNGREAAYGESAQRWFATYLPMLIRESRWNTSARIVATRRVDRAPELVRARTPGSLEDSLTDIQSSREKTSSLRRYAQTTDCETLLMVMRVARTIPNSTDRSTLLEYLAPRYLDGRDSTLAAAFFRIARTVPSSEELRDLLISVVPFAGRSETIVTAIIESSRMVPSSSDRAAVLATLVESNAVKSDAAREKFVYATQELPGEHDRRRVMLAASRH